MIRASFILAFALGATACTADAPVVNWNAADAGIVLQDTGTEPPVDQGMPDVGSPDAGDKPTEDMGAAVTAPITRGSQSSGATLSTSPNFRARIVVGPPQPTSESTSTRHRLIVGPNAERP